MPAVCSATGPMTNGGYRVSHEDETSPMTNAATLLMLALFLVSCGSDKSSPSAPSAPTPPPTPAAAIDVAADGTITLHPSSNRRFKYAFKFPVQIRETAGGTAIWNAFVVTYVGNDGGVIERFSIGADAIRQNGYRDIAARSVTGVEVTARFNQTDFGLVSEIRVVLQFIDNKDGRLFEVRLDTSAFDGIEPSRTPALLPAGKEFSITSP